MFYQHNETAEDISYRLATAATSKTEAQSWLKAVRVIDVRSRLAYLEDFIKDATKRVARERRREFLSLYTSAKRGLFDAKAEAGVLRKFLASQPAAILYSVCDLTEYKHGHNVLATSAAEAEELWRMQNRPIANHKLHAQPAANLVK